MHKITEEPDFHRPCICGDTERTDIPRPKECHNSPGRCRQRSLMHPPVGYFERINDDWKRKDDGK
jgi:hypothetical protein